MITKDEKVLSKQRMEVFKKGQEDAECESEIVTLFRGNQM